MSEVNVDERKVSSANESESKEGISSQQNSARQKINRCNSKVEKSDIIVVEKDINTCKIERAESEAEGITRKELKNDNLEHRTEKLAKEACIEVDNSDIVKNSGKECTTAPGEEKDTKPEEGEGKLSLMEVNPENISCKEENIKDNNSVHESPPFSDVHPSIQSVNDLVTKEDFEELNKNCIPENKVLSAYELEIQAVGADIIFPVTSSLPLATQWTNSRWLSFTRKVRFCELCTRLTLDEKNWFGATTEKHKTRKLAIYEEPNLILILRECADPKELQKILDIQNEPIDVCKYLIVETVIDPITCKLRLSSQTTITSIESFAGVNNVSPRRRAYFELITPTEIVILSAHSKSTAISHNSTGFLGTKSMEVAIGKALYAAHCPTNQTKHAEISWKHQLVLGTLTSFVVSGSQKQLEKAISIALGEESDSMMLPSHIIDQQDESGRTALHYACTRCNSAAVIALVGVGANVCIPVKVKDGEEMPVHLSARYLDHMSLSTILSALQRPDPNIVDRNGHTAMYLAATEGVGSLVELKKCISVLDAWGGNMGKVINPVALLSSQWKYFSLGPVLANEVYRFPLPSTRMSVGASHLYPIHTALIAFRKKIQDLALSQNNQVEGLETLKSQLRRTLQILLEHGCEPNERIEGLASSCKNGGNELMEHVGFAPLQILAAAAQDAENLSKLKKKNITNSILSSIADALAGVADVLIQCGARLNIESPPKGRLTKMTSSQTIPSHTSGTTRTFPEHDANLKMEGNKNLMDLLGGKEKLDACKKIWVGEKVVEGTGRAIISPEVTCKDGFNEPGGSSDKSCAICWRVFGTLMNRKHKCCISTKYVCDDCSTKRMKENGKEFRLSDGQFLLVRADRAQAVALMKDEENRRKQEKMQRNQLRLEQVQQKRQEKEQDQKTMQESLFGSVMHKATKFLAGDIEEDELDSLQATLGQTRNALNERGERLNSLSEKTERLMSASEDFAKMAKELEKSQSGGLFW